MGVSDIFNFIRIDDRTSLAGQPSEEQLRTLPGAGYVTVINLAPTTVSKGTPVDECTILHELGLDYHHIPVSWDAPEAERFGHFVQVMDGIGDRRTLIHCVANYRVTAFYSLYAMQRLGWSKAQADALIARIWTSHLEVSMSDNWKRLIAEVQRSLGRLHELTP
jgi:protein tyrosine phosphatase (PTP) superfamily phosphohydrolase (DUF442 family)